MYYTAEDSEKHGQVRGNTYERDGRTDRRMGDCYTQLSLIAQGSSKVANRPRRIPWLFVALTMLLPIVLHFNLNVTSYRERDSMKKVFTMPSLSQIFVRLFF